MLLILSFLLACTPDPTPEQKETRRLWHKCASKRSGSQPECWDQRDWELFCEHVVCKEVK